MRCGGGERWIRNVLVESVPCPVFAYVPGCKWAPVYVCVPTLRARGCQIREACATCSLPGPFFSPSASRFFSVVVVHVWGGKTAEPVVTSNFPCLVVGCFFPTPHHPSRLALPHRTVRVHIRSCPSSLGRQAACHPLAYRLHTHLCNSRSSSERQHHHAAPSHQISISPSTYEPRFMHPSDL